MHGHAYIESVIIAGSNCGAGSPDFVERRCGSSLASDQCSRWPEVHAAGTSAVSSRNNTQCSCRFRATGTASSAQEETWAFGNVGGNTEMAATFEIKNYEILFVAWTLMSCWRHGSQSAVILVLFLLQPVRSTAVHVKPYLPTVMVNKIAYSTVPDHMLLYSVLCWFSISSFHLVAASVESVRLLVG